MLTLERIKNMKLIYLFSMLSMFSLNVFSQWKPVEGHIKTKWADEIDVNKVLPEYPRPIMERTEWMNLNGLWKYKIVERYEMNPSEYSGDILVPFAIESSLSGVGKRIGDDKELVYRRSFNIPRKWKGNRVLLHFGAVDWKADVWVNSIKVGSHTGGFTPFSFDVTGALQFDKENSLTVRVWDPTDKGSQPRGKQVSNPGGIWYTPVTGIWQTVWLEPVPQTYIENLKIKPDIDNKRLIINASIDGENISGLVEVKVMDVDNNIVAEGKSLVGENVDIRMPENLHLWSPSMPYLYNLEISLSQKGETIDEIKSYAAMRKFSSGRDEKGIMRLELNNEPLFHFGPLDQGWWPDGLYTAPTDEALAYDIQKTKDLGFNMIRKHIKVEPARWYTYCDRMGIIVWQDMPSGDRNPEWIGHEYFKGTELTRTVESEECYRKEWKEIIDYLYSYPCIGVWVPFNEAWGQFKTQEIAKWTKHYDPSRLVNPASGGNHFTCGDMLDLHNYPEPKLYLYDAQRVTVLGEYGGIGLVVKNHIWVPEHNWGYIQFTSTKEVTSKYVEYANKLLELIPNGFSAAVYTQISDVEMEVNGLITYDRKVIKVDESTIKNINKKVVESLE